MGRCGVADTLKMALVHPRLKRGGPEYNLALLLELNRRAARSGARVILNTELALSGYTFAGRDEMASCAQSLEGPACRALGALAREFGVYLCLGLAEREPKTGILYNSAVILNPQGRVAALRRKVSAEPRWACPGPARQVDVCDTPFGRLGLLLCSETYFGLLPRVQALKGVDLLLVPANWPARGLDPLEMWRARAWENGFFLAACNRAGREPGMDFSTAPSCVCGPGGEPLLARRSQASQVFMAELPLEDGRLATVRPQRLAGRRPGLYYGAYPYLRQAQMDLGGYYGLPEPGPLALHCHGKVLGLKELQDILAGLDPETVHLLVLPAGSLPDSGGKKLLPLLRESPARAAVFWHQPQAGHLCWLTPDHGLERLPAQGEEPVMRDWGPARVGLCRLEDFRHPELAAALAKQGCDLAAVSDGAAGELFLPGLAVKSLERLGLAVALAEKAIICQPPEGHRRWEEVLAPPGGSCCLLLDTTPLRRRFFLDRVDYPWLWSAEPDAGGQA